MKNQDVINLFAKGEKGKTANLISNGVELINYSTVIAWHKDGLTYMKSNKYSATTSRIQNMIRKTIPNLIEREIIQTR